MNDDKVIEVFAAIEHNKVPDLGFDMDDWFNPEPGDDSNIGACGSVACFAGWTGIMAGLKPNYDRNQSEYFTDPVTGAYLSIELFAARALGLTEDEAGWVFYLEDLDEVYAWFAYKMGVDVQVLRDKVAAAI